MIGSPASRNIWTMMPVTAMATINHQKEKIGKIRIAVEILLFFEPPAVQHGGGANHQGNGGVVAQQPGPMPEWVDDIGLEGRADTP